MCIPLVTNSSASFLPVRRLGSGRLGFDYQEGMGTGIEVVSMSRGYR